MSAADSPISLERLLVQGYRSCKSTEFVPHPRISALIGINGAGKTNVLSAIRVLSNLERDRHYAAFERSVEGSATAPTASVTAWFRLAENESGSRPRIGLRITMTLAASGTVAEEIADTKEEWNFVDVDDAEMKDLGWVVVPTYLRDGLEAGRASQRYRLGKFVRHDQEAQVLWEASISAHVPDEQPSKLVRVLNSKNAVRVMRVVNSWRRNITYYSASQFTDPSRCPTNFEVDANKRLEYSYRGVSPHLKFLFDLYTLRAQAREQYDNYEEFVSRSHLGLVSRISWKEVRLSSHTVEVRSGGEFKKQKRFKILVIPSIQVGSAHVSFNQLSEGTFRTLALMFYVMTTTSECLLIEEPEVCIHHGLLTKTVDTIKAYSSSKQVICSTHSDLVIDCLAPENVFVVENSKSGTKVSELKRWIGKRGDRALTTYLGESGTLGEYWRSGGLSS